MTPRSKVRHCQQMMPTLSQKSLQGLPFKVVFHTEMLQQTQMQSWSVGQTRVRSITCMRCSLQETGRGMGSLHRESLHEYSSGHRCVMQVKKTPQSRWPLYALGIVVSDPLLIGQREIF